MRQKSTVNSPFFPNSSQGPSLCDTQDSKEATFNALDSSISYLLA
jgi:hypothetical protein